MHKQKLKHFWICTNIFCSTRMIKTESNNKRIEWHARGQTLNANKSNYVIFRPYQRKLGSSVNIQMFDNSTHTFTSLEWKEHVKYLGILLDSYLRWKFYIEYVALKIRKIFGVIARLRHFVPLCTLLNIYRSLIFPYMSYGLAAWSQAAKTHLEKLLVLSFV